MEKNKKLNLSLRQLESGARKLIKKQGFYLLAFDVIDSKRFKFQERLELQERIKEVTKGIERDFSGFLIGGPLAVDKPDYKGFYLFPRGDDGYCFFKNELAISIVLKSFEDIKEVKFRWAVAKNGWDPILKNI